MLGRLLEPDEIVHHKNEDPSDNRPENLEVMTQAEHIRLHRGREHHPIVTKEQIQKTYGRGMSIKETAKALSISRGSVSNYLRLYNIKSRPIGRPKQ